MIALVWTDSLAAEMIAAELEEQGIDVLLEPVHSGLFSSPIGRVRVRVPQSRAPSAWVVLEHLRGKHPNLSLDYVRISELPPFAAG